MQNKKLVQNESGMALMAVMIFTVVIAVTMSSVYLYNVNQARYHAKIKQAYQMIGVMEGLARAVKQAYDSGSALSMQGGTVCPPSGPSGVGQDAYDICAGDSHCIENMQNHLVCLDPAVTSSVCIERQDLGKRYCAHIFLDNTLIIPLNGGKEHAASEGGHKKTTKMAMNMDFSEQELHPMKLSKASSWLKRMDQFYGSEDSQKNIQAIAGIFWQKAFAGTRQQYVSTTHETVPLATPVTGGGTNGSNTTPPIAPGNSVVGGPGPHTPSDPFDMPVGPTITAGPTTACGQLQSAGTITTCPEQSLIITLDKFTCPTAAGYDPTGSPASGGHNIRKLCTSCRVGHEFCPAFTSIDSSSGGGPTARQSLLPIKQKFYVF